MKVTGWRNNTSDSTGNVLTNEFQSPLEHLRTLNASLKRADTAPRLFQRVQAQNARVFFDVPFGKRFLFVFNHQSGAQNAVFGRHFSVNHLSCGVNASCFNQVDRFLTGVGKVIAFFPLKTRYNAVKTFTVLPDVIASFPIKTRYNIMRKSP